MLDHAQRACLGKIVDKWPNFGDGRIICGIMSPRLLGSPKFETSCLIQRPAANGVPPIHPRASGDAALSQFQG